MMRSAVLLPPRLGGDRARDDRQWDDGRERARGQCDRAIEPGHLLKAVDHAEHEPWPQPERQRPHDAFAVWQPARHLRAGARSPRTPRPRAAARSRPARSPGLDTASAGAEKRSSKLRGEVARAHAHVDLEEALEAPRLEVAGAGQHLLAIADERLRVQHRRVAEDAHARVQQLGVVEALRGGARAVVGARRHEQPDAHSPAGGAHDPPDHRLVGHVGVHHVERLARAVEQLRDGGRDGAVGAGRVVQHRRRDRARLELREEGVELLRRDGAAEPAEAREEHELQLRDDRPGEADEQVVEAAIGEMVLDPRAADPADAAVDDEQLAVVDAPRRAHDANLDAAGPQPLVEAT